MGNVPVWKLHISACSFMMNILVCPGGTFSSVCWNKSGNSVSEWSKAQGWRVILFSRQIKEMELDEKQLDRTVHPMLHLRPPGQPPTLADAPMVANQPQQTSFPTVATSPISYPTVLLPSVLPPIQAHKPVLLHSNQPFQFILSCCLQPCTLC